MSNHYHLVLHISRGEALSLTRQEVVQRWQLGHKLPVLVQRWVTNQLTCKAETEACFIIIESLRTRLWNLSWFMKELNFDIACQANQEDDCSGHFWESRFKSQALLGEKALAAAMAYVDLNPLRAGIADKPETSDFTSIKARAQALREQKPTAPFLFPFIGDPSTKKIQGIPFRLMDYLELVDWTARQYRENKAMLKSTTHPILSRLNISQPTWLKACNQLEKRRTTAIGCYCHIHKAKQLLHKSRIHLFRLDA